eukprot:7451258-Pyramimonas_sp.AAC.2
MFTPVPRQSEQPAGISGCACRQRSVSPNEERTSGLFYRCLPQERLSSRHATLNILGRARNTSMQLSSSTPENPNAAYFLGLVSDLSRQQLDG